MLSSSRNGIPVVLLIARMAFLLSSRIYTKASLLVESDIPLSSRNDTDQVYGPQILVLTKSPLDIRFPSGKRFGAGTLASARGGSLSFACRALAPTEVPDRSCRSGTADSTSGFLLQKGSRDCHEYLSIEAPDSLGGVYEGYELDRSVTSLQRLLRDPVAAVRGCLAKFLRQTCDGVVRVWCMKR